MQGRARAGESLSEMAGQWDQAARARLDRGLSQLSETSPDLKVDLSAQPALSQKWGPSPTVSDLQSRLKGESPLTTSEVVALDSAVQHAKSQELKALQAAHDTAQSRESRARAALLTLPPEPTNLNAMAERSTALAHAEQQTREAQSRLRHFQSLASPPPPVVDSPADRMAQAARTAAERHEATARSVAQWRAQEVRRQELKSQMHELQESFRLGGCRCVTDRGRNECRFESVADGKWRARISGYIKSCPADCERWAKDPSITSGCASETQYQAARERYMSLQGEYEASAQKMESLRVLAAQSQVSAIAAAGELAQARAALDPNADAGWRLALDPTPLPPASVSEALASFPPKPRPRDFNPRGFVGSPRCRGRFCWGSRIR